MKNFVKKIISILAILSILVIKLWPIVANCGYGRRSKYGKFVSN